MSRYLDDEKIKSVDSYKEIVEFLISLDKDFNKANNAGNLDDAEVVTDLMEEENPNEKLDADTVKTMLQIKLPKLGSPQKKSTQNKK